MRETTKAALRRSHDPVFVQRYFTGEGVDLGANGDPLAAHAHLFPRVSKIESWDRRINGALTTQGLAAGSFDFLHSAHGLADDEDPAVALSFWLELLKPGGYAVVTLPDEELYGKGEWPSRFNRAHKASFTIFKSDKALPRSVNVLDIVQAVSPVAECERVTLVREHYDETRNDEDQTARGPAECAIELVLRKRAVPTSRELFERATHARSADQSRAACKEAVRLYPYRFEVCHRAMLELLRWDMPEEADDIWEQCLKRLPTQHLPRLYHALHAIARGKLQEGFKLREKVMGRFGWQRRTTTEPPSNVPEWQGEPLAGKTIAIWSEFGLGDEIFFLRFARIFRERCDAARVVVVCQAPLVELYRASGEADDVINVDDISAMPQLDYWVYPHAIPIHLPLDLEALPETVPYLRASPDVPSKLPAVAPGKLKVGVVFKGNPTHENDSNRSLPSLAVLNDLFEIADAEFFSLQKGAGSEESAEYATRLPNFHDVGAQVNTMAETASVIEGLDLVITVDTSVAHVAGAMGKRVWLMLPFYGDWRWHYTREDSPWYPTMRLFRRHARADWSEVVARMNGRMLQLVADKQALGV